MEPTFENESHSQFNIENSTSSNTPPNSFQNSFQGRGRGGGKRPNSKPNDGRFQKVLNIASNMFKCHHKQIQIFENVVDPFNIFNNINVAICKDGPLNGSLVITHVNGREVTPQLVYGVPSMKAYYFNEEVPSEAQLYYFSNKWCGQNITIYKYYDDEENEFITAKPRAFPFIKDIANLPILSLTKKYLNLEQDNEKDKQANITVGKPLIEIRNLTNPLLIQLKKTKIQSITYEMCGSEVAELVKYSFDCQMKPLFTTDFDGNISPVINNNKDFESEELNKWSTDIGPNAYNFTEMKQILRDFKYNALHINESYRSKENRERGYNFENFLIEGKVVYLMDKKLNVIGRNLYKVKPNDVDFVRHTATFDSSLNYLCIEALSKIFQRGEKLTEKNVQKEMDLNNYRWSRYKIDAMNLLRGIPNLADGTPSSKQKMLIMVGIPGSGKSTAANYIISNNPGWKRVNQDEMKTRQVCELHAKEYFSLGFSVIVDRCNFDIQQRNVWVKLATQSGVNDIRCIHFNIPHEVCKARVSQRQDHPTIPAGDEGHKIIDGFARTFRVPIAAEGFSEIIRVSTVEEVQEALEKVIPLATVPEIPERAETVIVTEKFEALKIYKKPETKENNKPANNSFAALDNETFF